MSDARPSSLVPMAFVSDIGRSIAFYEKLGFVVRNTFVPPECDEPSWAWLDSAGAHLMLARATEPIVARQQGILFYLYCDDLEGYRETLLAAGVDTGAIDYPFYSPRGEFRLTDPDGYALMVTHT